MKKQIKNTINTSSLVAALVIGVIGTIILFKAQSHQSPDADASKGSSADSAQTASSLDELVGKPAPKFSLTDINGKEYSTENLKGKNVVLFFNEGLMCYPACWNQIAKFGSDSRFNSNDTIALSIVLDPKKDWSEAIAKMPELAAAKTLFDDGGYAARAFNVLKLPSSMHYGLLPGHTYVVIDKAGIVRYVFDDPRMAIRNDDIFAKVQTLK